MRYSSRCRVDQLSLHSACLRTREKVTSRGRKRRRPTQGCACSKRRKEHATSAGGRGKRRPAVFALWRLVPRVVCVLVVRSSSSSRLPRSGRVVSPAASSRQSGRPETIAPERQQPNHTERGQTTMRPRRSRPQTVLPGSGPSAVVAVLLSCSGLEVTAVGWQPGLRALAWVTRCRGGDRRQRSTPGFVC
jgi:hypothetical protein